MADTTTTTEAAKKSGPTRKRKTKTTRKRATAGKDRVASSGKKKGPRRTSKRTKKATTRTRSRAAAKTAPASKTKKPNGRKTKKKTGRGRGGALSSASITAIQAELARRLDDLHRERDDLVTQIEALDDEIAMCNGSAGGLRSGASGVGRKRGRARGGSRGAGGRRPKNATNLVTALKKLLTRRTMGVSEMADAVQKAGYRTSSPNFRTIVNQTLIKNEKVFKRVSRGQYTAR